MKRLSVIIFNLLLLGLPVLAWASGGGEKATKLERKVDLANLSGINYLFASWYNDNIWLYAFVVTVAHGCARPGHCPGYRCHPEDDRLGCPQDRTSRIKFE